MSSIMLFIEQVDDDFLLKIHCQMSELQVLGTLFYLPDDDLL